MKYVSLITAGFALFSLTGCVQQSEIATLQARISQQDQQIQQLQGQLSGVQPAQADTWSQVQNLRQEMATMKGQIDNLNHATSPIGGVSGLAWKVARHEQALRQIESSFSMNLDLDAPAAFVPGAPVGGPVPAPYQPQVQQPQPYVQSPQAATPPQAQAPAQTDIAQALYDSGYKSFTDGQYSVALNAFTDFTNTYPQHALIGNAWFWKGESNFRMNNYANAALDYEQVISKYPQNQKVPAAYLKQAMCFSEVDKKDVARYRLEDLIKKFPNAPEASRAKQLLADLG